MNNLSIQRHERIASFVDQCEEWLLSDHVANNELISSAQLLNSPEYSNSEPIYLASVVNNGTVCGCAIQALPDSLHVSNIPDEAALMLLLDRLSFGSPINWLTASEEQANKLAKIWQSQFGNSWTPKTRWLLHSVSRERLCVQAASGHLRQARNLDKQIVKEWGNRYKSEAPSPIDIPRFLLRKVDEGNLFIWDHDGARSLFAISN